MSSATRTSALLVLLIVLISTSGLAAQAAQGDTELARIDAAGRTVTNGLVQALRSLPRRQERYRLQVGDFTLLGMQIPLGSLWANNLTTYLASAAAAQGSNIVLSAPSTERADLYVQGEVVLAGDTVRIFTRLLQGDDRTVLRALWSDLALDPLVAAMLQPVETDGIPIRDSYEPDSRASPLSFNLGSSQVERTLHNSDEDWFMIQVPENGVLVLETTGAMDTLMALFAPDSAEPFQEDDDSGEDTNARIEYPVNAGQTILVRVNGYDGETGRYAFHASLEPLPSGTRNDTRDRALPLALDGEARRQNFDGPEAVHWFSLAIPGTGGLLQVRTTGNLDTLMEVYDDQGQLLMEDDDSGDEGNAKISIVLQEGEYFLKLREYEGTRGIYRLEAKLITLGPADQYEPDDTRELAKPINPETQQRRNFNHPGDVDWAMLDLRQAGTYGISARPPRDNGLDTYIEVYNTDGELLAEDDDGGRNLDAYLEIELNPGRYYLKVWQLDEEVSEDGSYELLIRRL